MSKPSPDPLQKAIKAFLHHMDANCWRDQGQPNYPSETWPYTLLTSALVEVGDKYQRKAP
jgi:hypothetical protein